jgi:metal-dependent amidase/aminoacylase/carboxypeptidase family protein
MPAQLKLLMKMESRSLLCMLVATTLMLQVCWAARLYSWRRRPNGPGLIVLFQPDEEHGEGARAMLNNALYDKIPKPDVDLGQHLLPALAGTVHVRPGTFLASADSLRVVAYGRGGHASSPQDAIDPIAIAASIIVR